MLGLAQYYIFLIKNEWVLILMRGRKLLLIIVII
jgi:hypothetical protein